MNQYRGDCWSDCLQTVFVHCLWLYRKLWNIFLIFSIFGKKSSLQSLLILLGLLWRDSLTMVEGTTDKGRLLEDLLQNVKDLACYTSYIIIPLLYQFKCSWYPSHLQHWSVYGKLSLLCHRTRRNCPKKKDAIDNIWSSPILNPLLPLGLISKQF